MPPGESSSLTTLIFSVIVALVAGGAVTAVITSLFTRDKTESEARKAGADAIDIIEQAAARTMSRLMEETDRLGNEVSERIRQSAGLQAEIDLLKESMTEIRMTHRREIHEMKNEANKERMKCDNQLEELRAHVKQLQDDLGRDPSARTRADD